MTAILDVDDLPTALQSAELADTMVAGALAQALRVAPCLTDPTSTAWAATTAYAVGDQVRLTDLTFLEVTVAGTSGGSTPTAPPALAGTVTDGTVTWKRIGPTSGQYAEAKLVLIGAIKRWAESGTGALQSQTAGPFSQTVDTRTATGYHLRPAEILQLQAICQNGTAGAFTIDTAPSLSCHAAVCSLVFGASYCSCGADIAGFPLYECDV